MLHCAIIFFFASNFLWFKTFGNTKCNSIAMESGNINSIAIVLSAIAIVLQYSKIDPIVTSTSNICFWNYF